MSSTRAPQLLPIFRSAGQARLLARVYLGSSDPATLADLARELDLDDGGLTREADRLERAGLVRSERIGRSRILHPNGESPYFPELYGLLLKAFGPAMVIGPLLATVAGIEHAYVYGSWAARYLGRPGDEPADIDVMVIGSPSRMDLSRVARELEPAFGREVNITAVSPSQWEKAPSGFLKDVRHGPLVAIDLDRGRTDG
jgi:predicted nucleotidyltransferase